jgi:hypothetical protein
MTDLFAKVGDEYACSAGGTVLLCAGAIYGPPHETTPEGRARGAVMIDAILSVACERGFVGRDLLETLLARNEDSERVKDLARQIDKCLGMDGLYIAVERMRRVP